MCGLADVNDDGMVAGQAHLLYHPAFENQALTMSDYENSKKARRIAAVVYLVIFTVIMTGTYFSEQQKAAARKQAQALQSAGETAGGFPDQESGPDLPNDAQ